MEPAIEDSHSTCASPTECNSAGHRRMKMLSDLKDHDSMAFSAGMHDESGKKKRKTSSKVNDYSDPFAVTNLLDGLYYGKYGSAAKDIESLLSRTKQKWNFDLATHPAFPNMAFSVGMHDESGKKRLKTSSKVNDHSDPIDIPNFLGGLDYSKYGSAAKDIESLFSRKKQKWNFDLATHPAFPNNFVDVEKYHSEVVSRLPSQQANHLVHHDVIVLEDDSVSYDFAAVASPVVIIISDDEDTGDLRPSNSCQEVVSVKLADQCLTKDLVDRDCAEGKAPSEEEGKATTKEEEKASTEEEGKAPTVDERSLTEEEESLASGDGESEVRKDKGVYVGVEDYVVFGEENHHTDNGDDGLADIWKEMTMELECSKDIAGDPSSDKLAREGEEDCHHSFILKDDLGYVCRICGVIERGIETIFDFQYSKTTRTIRTYMSQSQNSKDREPTQILLDGVKFVEDEFRVTEISAHPRHRKQMKPHQVEGFNFLLSNLMADNPGGCILAHAPGSGKTFMIISFVQSFLAKYPDARPVVVLPKGILATWKKEFQTWQVEDIPLYDFYSEKADNRSQQLDVLKQWIEQKSILFLGYKQLSSIVCASGTTCKTTAACQEILLKVPSILILDEGHTPRNENTDVLHSLAKVQTPRKVVLSGTLYQNHVREVFNILNLVRPKFLKLDTSRTVVKRIMSRVQITGVRKQIKANADLAFYDLVEHTLQMDDDFRRKVTVIQDLREMTSKVLHYYKGDFLDELPGLEDFTLLLNLNPRQKPEVEKLKRLGTKFKRSAVGSAVYMHPQLKYFSENIPAAGNKLSLVNEEKIDEMLEKLDVRDGVKAKFFLNMLSLCESTGEKLLVFSQYLLPLKFLERLAMKVKGWSPDKEIFMISGDSSSELRERSMDRFNSSPDAKIFFGSIKACGEGISLVGASRILILDVHLNPSVTRQAIGRAFRPGQKRKVYTYRLVAADSPEEEDHFTCFRKELISRMWFEWNEYCGHQDFEVKTVDVNECGDSFLESPLLRGDVKVLYKR